MTQDMKKDMILENIAKRLVRNGRTPVRIGAYSSALKGVLRTILLLLMMTVGAGTAWGQTTYTYYALNNKDKGYLKQYKGIVGNDGTFRYENAYDGNGSSIWVRSSDGYLQQEMYYLNVANGKTLYLSTTPVTQWDVVADSEENTKNRLQMRGSTKILGLNDNTPVLWEPSELTGSKKYKYAACTLTVTENNSKWDGPKDKDFTVQSPQLLTYLRTYYVRNITVTIDKNDAGTENVKVVDKKDSRCYCMRTYKTSTDTNKGTKWDYDADLKVIYNLTTSNQSVTATYDVAPLDPIALATHSATEQSCKVTITPKALTPGAGKKYLLFNTQDNNYRFPYANTSLSDGDLLPVNGKASDLTEAINEDLSWDIEVDGEGYYSFKNVATGCYFYYDAADYTVSDYGAAKIGSTTPGTDTRYKFRLFSGGVKRDPFGGCYYIIPYDKQFAVYKSDATIEEVFFALYMNTSNTSKIASITKAIDAAKWKLYTYEWQNRLWSDYTINGEKDIYTAGSHNYTATTWISRNIKDSPSNTDYCTLSGSKTKTGITYTWQLTGLDDYVTTTDALSEGTSTLTANVTLPPGTRNGTLKVTAMISSPFSTSNNTSIPVTLYNLNPTFTEISALSEITDASGLYKLKGSSTYSSSNKPAVTSFSGTLDGGGFTITGLTSPLFETIDGGTVRNLMMDNITVSSGDGNGNTGAIACEAKGTARIYNCGILATESTVTTDKDGYTHIATNSSTVSGTNYVGGLVGLLDGEARVINCFSYADIMGGEYVGGIVGYNNVATTSANLKTMVMNCMFYGDFDNNTTNRAPIYNGQIITNRGDQSGVSNFNYFWGDANYVKNQQINTYHCALMAETRFLQRFEFFRHLLNSHRELAAWWATGSTANKDQMMKWVLEPSQIGTSTPYPILKEQGRYHSVVNIDNLDVENAKSRSIGTKLGTLTVNIQMDNTSDETVPFHHPGTGNDEAAITTSQLTLDITDKDPTHFNFNYGKVQLPYYNDVGTKNYTGNRVVTGWKITSITTNGSVSSYNSFTTGDDATANANGEITAAPYNFADRYCTEKDLYGKSGRVFNQGAYWDVPEGVTGITIQPYWAKAAYLADPNVDVTYKQDMSASYDVPNVGGGQIYTNDKNYSIAGENQKVYTTIGNAANALGKHSEHTVYDYAIVLVGNYHKHDGISSSDAAHFYTIMSADFDHDNEPDYSYILRFNSRTVSHPVRVDFLNIPGLGMAQKSTGGTGTYNFGILIPKGWFESTNTSLFQFTQFEYEHKDRPVTAPLILQGGVMEQWVSFSQNGVSHNTPYFHVGGNVWFKEFHRGTHQDKQQNTKHPPISVTGGDFDEFYLTGLYRADFNNYNDNLECYINGGRFGIVAGAAQEGAGDASTHANGNVVWQIQNADIDEFYGGGLNAVHPVEGNITTVITGGYIQQFCGGPKFGDMNSGKTVITTATGCKFDTFFGAGYGGNSYSRFTPSNINSINGDYGESNWNTWLNNNYKQEYNSTYKGVSTTFFTQYIPMSNNTQNVARLLIDFVSFSLATTHEVTSKLTGCTITGNFYGGGSLGKVDGPVTSILDGCTVEGNVFGAGFSASTPKVEVMNTGGFVKAPYFDSNLGVYLAPTFPATVTYTWEHSNTTVNSTDTAIDKTNHILYTNVDIEPSNLGSVNGNVILTLKGDTKVGTMVTTTDEETGETVSTLKDKTGNVFGGGEQSYVTQSVGKDNKPVANTGNTIVKLQGNTTVLGNVFGGGDHGVVQGSATVKIEKETNSSAQTPTTDPEP